MATKQFREFDEWLSKDTCSLRSYPNMNHREVCIAEDAWIAALEWFRKRTSDFDHAWAIQVVIDEELGDE